MMEEVDNLKISSEYVNWRTLKVKETVSGEFKAGSEAEKKMNIFKADDWIET